jgi:hypothetical protein
MTVSLILELSSLNKFTEVKPPTRKLKGVGLISWDSVTHISRQNTLVHFNEAFNHVGFYELFIPWARSLKPILNEC